MKFKYGNAWHGRMTGAGTRILWVHGYTLDASSWQEVWAALPDYQHYGVDLPGHGESADFERTQTLPALGDALVAFARQHNIRHLVGLSFGGLIALQAAIQDPTWFETLTLGAPALGRGPTDPQVGQLYGQLYRTYAVAGAGNWLTDLWINTPPHLFQGAADRPERMQMLRHIIGRHRWTELGSPVMSTLSLHPQTVADLQTITARTRILVGDKEMPAFRQIAAHLATHIPHGEQVTLAGGVHHLCMLQVPERTAQLIAAQIASVAAQPTGATW